MTDEKYNVESLSQDDLVSGDDTLVVRARRPWGLLIAGLLFLALWVWREISIRVARESAKSQQAEISRLATENEMLTQELQRVKREHAALSGVARAIELKGEGPGRTASGKVLIDPTTKRAVVFVYRLPPNRRYQLLINGASGAMFDVSRRGSASVVIESVSAAESAEYTVTPQQNSTVYLRGVSTATTP
jgi:hypothetical protein